MKKACWVCPNCRYNLGKDLEKYNDVCPNCHTVFDMDKYKDGAK